MTPFLERVVQAAAALQTPDLMRDWSNVVFDAGKHPRGPNGHFIGGDAMKYARLSVAARDSSKHMNAHTVVKGSAKIRQMTLVGHQHAKNVANMYNDAAKTAAAKLSQRDLEQLNMARTHYQAMLQNDAKPADKAHAQRELRAINTVMSHHQRATGQAFKSGSYKGKARDQAYIGNQISGGLSYQQLKAMKA